MRRWLLTILVFGALMALQPVCAQDMHSSRIAQGDGLTLSQAVEQIRRQHKGRIVSAETRRNGNREMHHIKVLTEGGKVRTFHVQGRKLRSKG